MSSHDTRQSGAGPTPVEKSEPVLCRVEYPHRYLLAARYTFTLFYAEAEKPPQVLFRIFSKSFEPVQAISEDIETNGVGVIRLSKTKKDLVL